MSQALLIMNQGGNFHIESMGNFHLSNLESQRTDTQAPSDALEDFQKEKYRGTRTRDAIDRGRMVFADRRWCAGRIQQQATTSAGTTRADISQSPLGRRAGVFVLGCGVVYWEAHRRARGATSPFTPLPRMARRDRLCRGQC